MEMIIKTKKFILRPFKKSDVYSLQKNINDKAVVKYTMRIPYPYKLKHATEWVQKNINMQKKKIKTSICWAIDNNDEIIGVISLESIEKHKAELGYWLAKRYWNKGFMSQAVGIVTKIGLNKLKLIRIYAPVHINNKASCKVLKKNGYKLEGHLIKNGFKNNSCFDTFIFAKTR